MGIAALGLDLSSRLVGANMKLSPYILLSICCLSLSASAQAFTWNDLWARPDEQAMKLLQKGQAKTAAQKFEDPNWRAVAQYRSGAYDKAAKEFNQANTADGFYNQGNALAHLGEYQKAITAYDQALALNPKHEDAKYNRAIVEKLLKKDPEQKKQNKQQQKDQKQDQKKQDKPKQDQQKQKQNQQKQDQQKQDQQKQEQQKQEQQKQEQQKQDQQKQEQQKQDQQKQDQQKQEQQKQDQQKQDLNDQLLKQIPDDPGGLLKNKFLRDYYRRKMEGEGG
jgi:Ca-activated chloride channel family protein